MPGTNEMTIPIYQVVELKDLEAALEKAKDGDYLLCSAKFGENEQKAFLHMRVKQEEGKWIFFYELLGRPNIGPFKEILEKDKNYNIVDVSGDQRREILTTNGGDFASLVSTQDIPIGNEIGMLKNATNQIIEAVSKLFKLSTEMATELATNNGGRFSGTFTFFSKKGTVMHESALLAKDNVKPSSTGGNR